MLFGFVIVVIYGSLCSAKATFRGRLVSLNIHRSRGVTASLRESFFVPYVPA